MAAYSPRTNRGCRWPVISVRSKHSRRALATHRPAIAFARGAWTGVFTVGMPAAVKAASDAAVNVASRSRIKDVGPCARCPGLISRLRACWGARAPVGWAVIPARCTRRVPCSMTTSTQAVPDHRIDVEEAGREDRLGLPGQERAPALPALVGRGIDARIL
jgi:hypothetical protein